MRRGLICTVVTATTAIAPPPSRRPSWSARPTLEPWRRPGPYHLADCPTCSSALSASPRAGSAPGQHRRHRRQHAAILPPDHTAHQMVLLQGLAVAGVVLVGFWSG